MFELPLFPLNTVLFPGTPLQLHIFEDRYKLMIGTCIQNRQPFGVTLIRHGAEAGGVLAEPNLVGCSAQIIHVQRLDQGRMNIVALGKERIRILSVDREAFPYLVGRVEDYPMTNPNPEITMQRAEGLRPLVERFIQVLVEAGGSQFDLRNMPEDPLALANMAATLLQISPEQKQKLLAQDQADELLANLQEVYRRELALLRALMVENSAQQIGSFSQN
jgi:Lon protease-like protein